MRDERTPTFWDGARLGLYQANALGAPFVAAILWPVAPAVSAVCIVASALGWVGWKRDFDWRWRP
jgi:hypothetical protein